MALILYPTRVLSGKQTPASGGSGEMAVDNAQSYRSETDADLDLVIRAQGGDTAAFGELIDRHQRSVYGVVSRMVSSRDDADDLVQDVFVSVYKAIGSFRGDAKFSTWLHTITVNTTLKRLAKMKRQSTISIDDPATGLAAIVRADDDPPPAEVLEQSERGEAVRRAIDALPDKQRIVVVMHYFEQLSRDQVSAALGVSPEAVSTALYKARRRLLTQLVAFEQGNFR